MGDAEGEAAGEASPAGKSCPIRDRKRSKLSKLLRRFQMKLNTPVKPDHVRFVCIGCTHGVKIDPANLPLGDILLVTGDFTTCGLPNEVHSFNKKLG